MCFVESVSQSLGIGSQPAEFQLKEHCSQRLREGVDRIIECVEPRVSAMRRRHAIAMCPYMGMTCVPTAGFEGTGFVPIA